MLSESKTGIAVRALRIILFIVVFFLSIAGRVEAGTAAPPDSLDRLRIRYAAGLEIAVDEAIRRQTSLTDSLLSGNSAATSGFRERLIEIGAEQRAELNGLKKDYAVCEGCEMAQDFEDGLLQALREIDSVAYHYRALSLEAAGITLPAGREPVPVIIESNSGKPPRDAGEKNGSTGEKDEDEDEEESASTLLFGLSYDSHYAYLARDGGIAQSAISPSLTYMHSSGLYASISAFLLSGTADNWDGANFSLGYRYALSASVAGHAAWTHYWFAAASLLYRAETPDNIAGDMSFRNPVLTPAIGVTVDIGSAVEWALTLGLSHDFTLAESLWGGSLTFSPSADGSFGVQDYLLAEKRAQRMKKAFKAQGKGGKTSVAGIMDYSLTLPFAYDHDWFSVTPSLVYQLPLNVLAAGTDQPYLSFQVEASVTIF